MPTVPDLLAEAWRHHQAGNVPHAEQFYRQALQLDPRNAPALHLLGVLACQAGRPDLGVDYMRQAVAIDPGNSDFQCNLGAAYKETGRPDQAIDCYQQALRLNPNHATAWFNLGNVYWGQAKLDEAVRSYQQAVRINPGYVQAYQSLGDIQQAQGKLDAAVASYRHCLSLRPDTPEVHNNLGVTLRAQGKLDEAIACFAQAIRVRPSFCEAYTNWGVALVDQHKVGDAISRYQEALRLRPDFGPARSNLGWALTLVARSDEAVVELREAVRLQPDDAPTYNNLANALFKQGQLDETLASLREALRLQPDFDLAHHNLLFCLNYDSKADPDAIFAEHRRWAARHQPATAPLPHMNDRSPERRLRVGYVSPDLRYHPLVRYLEPVLAHHDPHQVEVFCYAEVAVPDAVTHRLRAMVPGWRWTCRRSADEVAQQVRADAIDILVDLAGHSANNRLDVFARKPAPVQATWLGYMNTTGLTTVDYRLTDDVFDPPGQPVRDTEELMRLPGGSCCFAPPADAPEIASLPALRLGYLTLGSLHNLFKLNAVVFDLWCQVLNALPTARLLMFRNTLIGETREAIRREFTRRGIAAERLDLRQGSAAPGYLKIYDEIDVSLDVFPYTGGTTTCESLWMGAPVLSLAGQRPAARGSAGLLAIVGLSDWVVETPEQYVALAVRTACDLDNLAGLRAALRPRLQATLGDAARFTRTLEDTYRSMWRTWCANK